MSRETEKSNHPYIVSTQEFTGIHEKLSHTREQAIFLQQEISG